MTGAQFRPGDYLVACPQCATGRVEVARRFWTLRGLLLAARYGSRTIVSCRECCTTTGWKQLALNAVAGWWSFPWGLGTPFVVLQNLLEIVLPTSDAFLAHCLRQVGIDPDDVRINARGLTGEQQRLIDATYLVIRRSALADGHLHEHELRLGVDIVRQVAGDRVAADEIIDGMLLADERAIVLDKLSQDHARLLLRMAFGVSMADGVLQPMERLFLESLARTLKLPEDAVAQMIAASQRRHDDGRKADSKPGTQGTTRLERALGILGVTNPDDIEAVQMAYRRLMLKFHPDRAGPDAARQAECTRRSQDLNWARDYLLSYAG